MINYLFAFIASFLISVVLAIPYINLLYKFNIRRVAKQELDSVVPGRSVKMGTPIMGGVLILFPVLILSIFFLKDWVYLPALISLIILGGIAGFIDEYLNTLERTFVVLRKSSKGKSKSLFSIPNGLIPIKKIFLIPWRWFEEALRVMGGKQKGMASHYKLLLQLFAIIVSLIFMSMGGVNTEIWIPFLSLSLNLGIFYYFWIGLLMLCFCAAFGITDGMDGLSAGTHSIAYFALGIFAALSGYYEIALLCFIVVGAEAAFLYFNAYPARLEMSDVGTAPLGMLFALVGVMLNRELALPLIGAVFVIEILSSIGQQWSVKLRGKRILLVAPIHHHFEKLGWHETKVVTRIWIFGLVMGALGLMLMLW